MDNLKSYWDGYQARVDGLDINDNPHPAHSRAARSAWIQGYHKAWKEEEEADSDGLDYGDDE